MKSRTTCWAMVLLLFSTIAGCGGGYEPERKGLAAKPEMGAKAPRPQLDIKGEPGEAVNFQPAAHDGGEAIDAAAVQRKIIYNASIKMQVEDFSAAEDKLQELIQQNGAILDKSEITGKRGTSRQGQWKVRVPSDNLASFRKAVLDLGEPEQNNLDSRDVTDEYYDLAERIKNKQVEVDSWRRLFEQTKTIPEMVTMKKELDRAQEELERFKGRLKVLKHLTDMTTVDISLRERGAYTPEQTPTFATTLGRTWGGSTDGLATIGKALVLCAVALTPWLVPMAVIAVPSAYWWRQRRKHIRILSTPQAALPADPVKPAEGS